MTQDPQSCAHANVATAAGEFEHYDHLGPGCWHPVKGGQCRSWQALIEHVQSVAAARVREQASADGYAVAVAVLRGVADRTGSPAARWAADYLEADPDRQAPGKADTP